MLSPLAQYMSDHTQELTSVSSPDDLMALLSRGGFPGTTMADIRRAIAELEAHSAELEFQIAFLRAPSLGGIQ